MKKIAYRLFLLTIFINIWFPKSGMKMNGIPITVGNVLFGLLLVFFIFTIRCYKIEKRKSYKYIIIALLYFFIRFFTIFFVDGNILSSIIDYVVPLLIYPLIYFLSINIIDSKEKLKSVMKIFVLGFIFLCIYGILQYTVGVDKVTIPGLTVNLTDYLTNPTLWYLDKANGVSSYSKLFSTYQNGNVFGVGLIIIFPIVYEYINKISKIKANILLLLFIVIGLLTLSRTCWLGIGVYLVYKYVSYKKISYKRILTNLVSIPIIGLLINYLFEKFPSVAMRLEQTGGSNIANMSGRADGLNSMFNIIAHKESFFMIFIGSFGIYSLDKYTYEIVPTTIWLIGGLIGLFLWILSLIASMRECSYKNPYGRGAIVATLIWLAVSCIDGSFWLPPTGFNLWLVISIGVVGSRLYENTKVENQ